MRSRLLALGLSALVIAACGGGGGGGGEGTASTPTTTSAPTTASPVDLKVGDKVTTEGTQLAKPSNPDTRQIDPEQACRGFLETPDGSCEIVMMAGGNALWTVDPLPGGFGERAWHVRIWVRSKTLPDGGWDVALQLPENALFASVGVMAADVNRDGKPEVLVGYRSGGTGQFESYDVITYEPGKPLQVAAHRQGLHKGSVSLDGSNIIDYSADQQSPECCPTQARRTVITGAQSTFRVTAVRDVPIDLVPPDLFA